MNYNSIVNLFSIIGSLSSIVSLLTTLLSSARQKDEPMSKSSHNNSQTATVDHENKKLPQLKWSLIFWTILSVTLLSLFLLLYGYVSQKHIGWGVVATFIISATSLLVYAIKAYQSFDYHYVLPPQKLWQVLFNKIPSHIKNTNQVVFKFLVLKMEDSKEVNDAGHRIEQNYQGRKDFQVDVKSVQEIEKPVDVGDYCGVIFIVGDNCFDQLKNVQMLMDEYSKQLHLPIAYIRVGANHYHISKYHRISESYLDNNCANHLIMRSYRRSEHWIRLSRYSHMALWAVLCLLIALLIASARAGKEIVIQRDTLRDYKEQIERLHDTLFERNKQLAKFGVDRGKIHLSNELPTKLREEVFDVEALQNDVNFKEFVDGFVKKNYFFGEIPLDKVLLWLKNENESDLLCIYDSKNELADNKPKGKESMIGSITNYHDPLFVLWPGYNNKDTIWQNPSENTMGWLNKDNGACAVSKLIQDKDGHNEKLILQETIGGQEIALAWLSKNTSNAIAIYGFSYDGRLAVELDFTPDDLNKDYVRIYVQNLLFRNCVRKFTACITSFLNCYAPRIEQVKVLASDNQEQK